jgi:NAD(P)H-dependent flavin oxidoreductase YrpB (nitropropane dioxygenase family)
VTGWRNVGGTPPAIIQGGMGVAISSWRLARSVASRGQLGTVSGTALAVVLARTLQQGDPDGAVRKALSRLPLPGIADRVLDRYFVPGSPATGRSRPCPGRPSSSGTRSPS